MAAFPGPGQPPQQIPGNDNLVQAGLGPTPDQQQPPTPTTPTGPPPSSLPLHAGEQTMFPSDPNVKFDSDAEKLSPADWDALSNDLYQCVITSLGARKGALEQNLQDWSDAYDLIMYQKDDPAFDSSNLRLPFTAGQLESLLAYIAGQAIPPRMYIVNGASDPAREYAFRVEQFYNEQFLMLRPDGNSYYSRHIDWLHLALRDGTAVMETLWDRQRVRKKSSMTVPVTDPQTGAPVMGPDGQPQWRTQTDEMDVYTRDYAAMRPRILKEFILIPDESLSIEEAVACAGVDWLYEDQLDKMVRAKLLDSGEVEKALIYVTNGSTDVASDQTGTYDKDASQQISIGAGQGTLTSKFFKNRGPLKVWRIHSRQFDMNGDGIPEENVFWLHEQSQRMLGWMPYDYASGQRPFIAFSPFPRPDRFYGFSLIERLAAIQSEMDAVRAARRDRIDLGLSPPIAIPTGSENHLKRGDFRPGNILEVDFENGKPLLQLLELGETNIIPSMQDEAALKQAGSEYTGLNQPSMGVQSSGRRSAREISAQQQSSGTRTNLISMRFRIASTQEINFVHELNKQYMRTAPGGSINGEAFSLAPEVLGLPFNIGVVGASDPIDSTTRRNENLGLFQLMSQDPHVAGNGMRMYYLERDLLESFNKSNVNQILGTEQERQAEVQQQQAMQQAQAQQAAATGQPPPGQQPPQHTTGHHKPPGPRQLGAA